MLKRTITGFFILLVLAGFMALREVSILFFDAFTLFLIYGCLFEVLKTRGYHTHRFHSAMLYIYPAILAAIFILAPSLYASLIYMILTVLAYFVLFMLAEVVRLAMERKPDEQSDASSLLSRVKECMEILFYPVTLLAFLFALNHLGRLEGYVSLILALSVTIFTDVFAYLFGRMIKGPKFAPEISPKKTISGCCFGVLGGVIIAVVCWAIFANVGWLTDISAAEPFSIKYLLIFVVVGFLGSLATIFGDLVESAYKRKLGVKDFGNILPGHGGFMDRVDGMMMTATLTFAMFALFI